MPRKRRITNDTANISNSKKQLVEGDISDKSLFNDDTSSETANTSGQNGQNFALQLTHDLINFLQQKESELKQTSKKSMMNTRSNALKQGALLSAQPNEHNTSTQENTNLEKGSILLNPVQDTAEKQNRIE